MNDVMTIALVNRLPELQRLWQAIENFCAAHQLPAGICLDLRVAAEEIFTNIVKYGYSDAAEHPIAVELALRGNCLTVKIQDDAAAFNPLQIDPAHTAGKKKPGGRGVRLWRGLMDEIEYRRRDNKNILIIKKDLSSCNSSPKPLKASRP